MHKYVYCFCIETFTLVHLSLDIVGLLSEPMCSPVRISNDRCTSTKGFYVLNTLSQKHPIIIHLLLLFTLTRHRYISTGYLSIIMQCTQTCVPNCVGYKFLLKIPT